MPNRSLRVPLQHFLRDRFIPSKNLLQSFRFLAIHSCHQNRRKQVAEWINKGLPCVYTRQLSEDEAQINLGLSLMTELKKKADRFSGQPFSPIKLSTATPIKANASIFLSF